MEKENKVLANSIELFNAALMKFKDVTIMDDAKNISVQLDKIVKISMILSFY